MILIMIAAVLLIIIIMAQNPKGGGLSSTFGGSTATFGVERTNQFMDKATWTLAGTIAVLIFLSIGLTAKPSQALPTTPSTKKVEAKDNAQPTKPAAKPISTGK